MKSDLHPSCKYKYSNIAHSQTAVQLTDWSNDLWGGWTDKKF